MKVTRSRTKEPQVNITMNEKELDILLTCTSYQLLAPVTIEEYHSLKDSLTNAAHLLEQDNEASKDV